MLITNDYGIEASGKKKPAETASKYGQVYVISINELQVPDSSFRNGSRRLWRVVDCY